MKYILLISSVCLLLQVQAQSPDESLRVELGPTTIVKKERPWRFVPDAGEGGVQVSTIMRFTYNDYFLQRSTKGGVTSQVQIDLSEGKDRRDLQEVMIVGKEVLVFSQRHVGKQEDESYLYVQSYYYADLSPAHPAFRLATVPSKNKNGKTSYQVFLSPDKSKILAVVLEPQVQDHPLRHGVMKVMDRGLEEIWATSVTTAADGKDVFRVDDTGRVLHLSGAPVEGWVKKWDLYPEHAAPLQYHLWVYQDGGNAPEDHPMSLEGMAIRDADLLFLPDGSILCSGIYGARGPYAQDGVFAIRMESRNMEVLHASSMEFTGKMRAQYIMDNEDDKGHRSIEEQEGEPKNGFFEIRGLIPRAQGGAFLHAEQYRTTLVGTDKGMSIFYCRNNVLVASIDAVGEVTWSTIEPKRESDYEKERIGYSLQAVGDGVAFVFTGKSSSLDPQGNVRGASVKSNGLIAICVTIDGKGEAERHALFGPDDTRRILYPRRSATLSDGRMYLFTFEKYNSPNFNIATVTFPLLK